VHLILDTDMDSDCDDVAALGLLHVLADRGEVVPLAVVTSGLNAWSGPCVEAINTWYGRPDLPIGTARAPAPDQDSRYARAVAQRGRHRLQRSADATDALDLYRRILAAQPDGSVTIATIGDMTNLARLVATPEGVDLVRAKVVLWVCMGGNFIGRPAHDDLKLGNNNFTLDAPATYAAITRWPGPILFAGREVCSVPSGVKLGARFASLPPEHPLRIAYESYFGGAAQDRHVADIATVLAAVRGPGPLWTVEDHGWMDLQRDMTFTWRYADGGGRHHAYLRKQAPDRQVEGVLEELLSSAPKPGGP
jgi:hypothetical protein